MYLLKFLTSQKICATHTGTHKHVLSFQCYPLSHFHFWCTHVFRQITLFRSIIFFYSLHQENSNQNQRKRVKPAADQQKPHPFHHHQLTHNHLLEPKGQQEVPANKVDHQTNYSTLLEDLLKPHQHLLGLPRLQSEEAMLRRTLMMRMMSSDLSTLTWMLSKTH